LIRGATDRVKGSPHATAIAPAASAPKTIQVPRITNLKGNANGSDCPHPKSRHSSKVIALEMLSHGIRTS
jgi:hypothetical protein